MANIKTGVDKLVELVSQKKRVNSDEAAKSLGVGKDVIQEWAEFLEEEGIVTLDYSLSKTWISEKKITADVVLSNAKEVSSQKDAFARRIDVAITALEQETTGFEDIRKQFISIQSNIKTEIDTVKEQLGELDRYDLLKKNLDKDVATQRQEYDAVVKEALEKLKIEADKYDELEKAIATERRNLEEYSHKIEELKKMRFDYEHTIATLHQSLKNIDVIMADYRKRFDDSGRYIQQVRDSLDRLGKEVSEKKGSLLLKRVDDLKARQDSIVKAQDNMSKEIHSKTGESSSYASMNDKIHKGFEGFFSKTIDTEKLIKEIEGDKKGMMDDLEALKKKVTAFTLLTSNASIKTQMNDIEGKLKAYEGKRLNIRYKIEKLLLLIRGDSKSVKDPAPKTVPVPKIPAVSKTVSKTSGKNSR